MFQLSFQQSIGVIITLLIITIVGIYSGKRVKNSSDFSTGGRKAGSYIVTGNLAGAIAGGASTIGTAQLAYYYGFSALWFNLGAGLGFLFLALVFVNPLYKSGKHTIPQIIEQEFGSLSGTVSSIFISLGMFLNIVAQTLAAVSLLCAIFKIGPMSAAIIAILLMIFYVSFGGIWGTGIVGIVKLTLLYITSIVGGYFALKYGGGISHYLEFFPKEIYFNLFSRGVLTDGSQGFSVILGILSTQTYIQAVISGRSAKVSKKGALISAMIVPPLGIAGVFIGLFMRMNYPYMDPVNVFPKFILNHINPWLGGIAMGTLLIAVIGSGAGLTLGISTIITKDIYSKYINTNAEDDKILFISRIFIILILLFALLFINGNMKSLILTWSFMGMGLRGASVFIPLCITLFLKGKVNRKYIILAIIFGPITVLIGKFILPQGLDPLALSLLVSILLIIIGLFEFKIHHKV